MISILIPVYNVDVTVLVTELSRQLQEAMPTGQIVVLDDGSSSEFVSINKSLETLPHTRFIQLEQNVGRIQARLQLAELATNNWLLFVDGDSKIVKEDFVRVYVNCTGGLLDVIVGGRVYQSARPKQCDLNLHWKYGTIREAIHEYEKMQEPYIGFMSNNFLIKKALFQSLAFSDRLNGYGHEDTLMGIQLEELRARTFYIDNPVLHNGVERAKVFISKTHNALMNLKALTTMVNSKALKRHVKLFRYYKRVKLLGLSKPVQSMYSLLAPAIEKNLISCSPSLILFDFYRLSHFIKLMKE